MNPDLEASRTSLQNASQAMQRGDRKAAREWALKAAAEAPGSEDPWLFLAALSNPRESVGYLERALKINPTSERARKGMHWAARRLREETLKAKPVNGQTQPTPAALEQTHPNEAVVSQTRPHPAALEQTQPHLAASEPKTQPRPAEVNLAAGAAPMETPAPRALAKYRWSFLTLIALAVVVIGVWAFWPGNASPALAFLHQPGSIFGAPADVAKPTYTLTSTPTVPPTATFTPSPTETPTPQPTDTPLPTDTPPPPPTATEPPVVVPTEAPPDIPVTGDTRWIDVDLTNQMLYAYEGDTIVNSFLVSTGVWQFPTVTGQYRIYVKYVSTLMAGDGYYLPDVPYTMYFYKGYGIHGTYWHHNFGHPMSHGCVNMYTPDAEWMFYWASVGTLVNIHY